MQETLLSVEEFKAARSSIGTDIFIIYPAISRSRYLVLKIPSGVFKPPAKPTAAKTNQ